MTVKDPEKKKSKKEFWQHEIRELSIIFSYLFVCFSVVVSFKALVLVQKGVEDFGHMYAVCAVEAIALGKIVALTQDLPFMNAWNRKPMVYSVFYKSVVMAVLVEVGGKIEEMLFHHQAEVVPHPILLLVSRELAFFFIFAVLFAVRDLDRMLGPGKLLAMCFGPRALNQNEPQA
jgi:hypothetical protein